jgi:hypothetical protein
MRQNDGYLSVTKGSMTVIYQLYEAGWLLYISYIRQDDGNLYMRKASVISQLLESGWRFSALLCVLCQLFDAGW